MTLYTLGIFHNTNGASNYICKLENIKFYYDRQKCIPITNSKFTVVVKVGFQKCHDLDPTLFHTTDDDFLTIVTTTNYTNL